MLFFRTTVTTGVTSLEASDPQHNLYYIFGQFSAVKFSSTSTTPVFQILSPCLLFKLMDRVVPP